MTNAKDQEAEVRLLVMEHCQWLDDPEIRQAFDEAMRFYDLVCAWAQYRVESTHKREERTR